MNNDHDDKCECAICKHGPEKVHEWEQDCLNKIGWYAHQVPNNYHTHGLPESCDHPDIQVVLALDPNITHAVVAGIIEEIKKGTKYQPNTRYSKIIKNLDVIFIEATESDRKVLRLVFPDANGNLEKEKMAPDFATQYDN